MPRQIVSQKDWDAMISHLDGDVQQMLRDNLESCACCDYSEFVEYMPDRIDRIDSPSSPSPCEPAADDHEEVSLDFAGWGIFASHR